MKDEAFQIVKFVVFAALNDQTARDLVSSGPDTGMRFPASDAMLWQIDCLLNEISVEAASDTAWSASTATASVVPLRATLVGALAALSPRQLRTTAKQVSKSDQGRADQWSYPFARRALEHLSSICQDAVAHGQSLYLWSWVSPEILEAIDSADASR